MRVFFVFALLSTCFSVFGFDSVYFPGERRRDSLLAVIGTAEREGLVDALNQLSIYYNIVDPPKAAPYIQQARLLAETLKYKAGLAFALKEEGMMMLNSGDIIQALKLLEEAKKISEEIEDGVLIGRTLHCIGLVYSAFGFHEFSLKYLSAAADKYETLQEYRLAAYCRYDQANVYVKNGEYHKAFEKVNEYRSIESKYEVQLENGPLEIALGDIYSGLGNDSLAMKSYESGLALFDEQGVSPQLRAKPLMALGHFYMKKGAPVEAKMHFKKAMQLLGGEGYDLARGELWLDLAKVCFKQGKLEQAVKKADSALFLAEKSKSLTLTAAVLFTRAEVQKKLGRVAPALSDITRAYQLQDSLSSVGYKSYIANIVASHEAEKAGLEILALNRKLENTRGELENTSTLSRVYLGTAIFFVLLLLIIIRNQKKLRSITKKLYATNEQVKGQNAELKKLNEERSDLIKLVAHDMRSPVNNIVSIADLLKRGGQTEQEKAEYVLLIETICRNIDHTISKFLGSNTSEGQLANKAPVVEQVDLHQVLLGVYSEFKPKAASKDITLQYHAPVFSGLVTTDKGYIVQVTANLVSNAIKFCPTGAVIKLGLFVSPEKIEITVEDNGPGIAPEEQKSLFEKYVTSSNKPTANESSTGLGLAICKQLTEALGGTIQLSSDVGKGCLFTVSVPWSEEDSEEEATVSSIPISPSIA